MLYNLDFKKPFYMETDASGYAIGGRLFQKNDRDEDCNIAYESKKLSNAEKITVRHKENY